MQKVIVTGENGALSLAVAAALKESGLQVENLGLRNDEWKQRSFSGYRAIVHIAGIVPKQGVSAEDFYRINTDLTKELASKAKAEGEKAKVSVRNARREAIEGLKKAVKEGLPEDAQKDAEEKVQKLHDKYLKKIDEVLAAKEKEVLTV